MAEHELVVRNGFVVDGTGVPGHDADVAVSGGRITAVGRVTGRGESEIDASGHLVTPGWVDVHTHYDGQVTWDALLEPSSAQGVTTVVMGNCGVGFAPVRPDRHEWLVQLMEGVEDIPGTALHEGITWGWESFPEYLDVLGSRRFALDVAAQVPHAALRGYVMGDRGADHAEAPTGEEIAEMGRLAAEAITAGALGFSTSRTVQHRAADGRPTPTLTAGGAELLGIADAIGATGRGVLQLVGDLVDLEGEFALVRQMAARSGRPLSLTVLQRPEAPAGEYRRILGLIERAALDGLTVRGQVAPRPVGLVMTLDSRVQPLAASPAFQALAGRSREDRLAALRDPAVRARVLAELAGLPPAATVIANFPRVFELGDPPRYDQPAEATLAARAEAAGVTALEIAYDVLVGDDGRGVLYAPASNYADGDLDAVREMLTHPWTVPGLGDAGAHVTLISDASFASHLLWYWGFQAPPGRRLPLEWIVRRQCADTAALVGLFDRGVLLPGYRADLNVIDPAALAVRAPRMRADLPAGGRRLMQEVTGYRATVVGGEVVVRDGEHTGALPGRLVRGARPAPGLPRRR